MLPIIKNSVYIILAFFSFLQFGCSDYYKDFDWNGGNIPGFSRTYGSLGYDYGWNIAHSPFDDGIVLTGRKQKIINGESNLWAIKTDNKGLIIWEKEFGGSRNEDGYDVLCTSDGSYIFIGHTWSFGKNQQIYVIKTDLHGNVKWENNYGGSMWEVGHSIIESNDGNYVIAGYSNSPGISSGNTDFYMIKIDPNGNIIWEKSYGNKSSPNHEWAYDLIEIYDTGFLIVGARDRYTDGARNSLIVRTDKNGNFLWEKELIFDGQIDDVIYSASISKFGSEIGQIYLCLSANTASSPNDYYPQIIKMDSYGNIDWQRKINAKSKKYHQFKAVIGNNDELVLVGSSYQELSSGYDENAFLTKIDKNGNLIWSYSYGSYDEDDWGWSVDLTPYDNIIFIGSTKSFKSSLFDVFLVGTNPDGLNQ